jgi:ribonuclease HI
MQIFIYTDGSARGNPGPGGYGVVLEAQGKRRELSEGFRLTTNNRMELLAAIMGLKSLKSDGHEVHIVSDSKYVVDAINKRWLFSWIKKGFKDKKNVDLWKMMIPELTRHQPTFHWVKGHNEHPQNERCDTLAVEASKQEKLKVDEAYELEKSGGNFF